jgi:metal transporter CNNM
MITGALSLKKKTAGQVMTRLEDVFMLSIKTILDFETVSSIQKKGYSRIPIFEEERKNVIALFHAKDLAFVDPNDNMPIKTLIEFYRHPTLYTFDDTPLDDVLKMFKEGKSHLAFVKQVYEPESLDPVHEITGIVTLEDVIEEILQTEIVDETDTLSDNRLKRRRRDIQSKDYSDFAKIGGGLGRDTVVSPQMALAAFQFLSCAVEAFKDPVMSPATLRKLMAQKVYFTVRVSQDDDDDASDDTPGNDHSVNLYKEGSPADFFILVIEGRVKVTVGREKLVFVSGPFSYFGTEALKLDQDSLGSPPDFVPDYSVDVIETTTFIKITRSVYLYAYRANEMENSLLRRPGMENSDADSGLLSICVSESPNASSHTTDANGSISITVTPDAGRIQTISGDVVKFDKPNIPQ